MEDWTTDYSLSLLRFWLKGQTTVTKHHVKIDTVSTVGSLPSPPNREIPVNSIENISLDMRFQTPRLALGIGTMLFGYFLILTSGHLIQNDLESILLGLLCFLAGVAVFFSGMTVALVLRRQEGAEVIEVPFYERGKLVLIEDTIRQALRRESGGMNFDVFSSSYAQMMKRRDA